jgi:aminocarboxymuconate-semialdehyde decarboxylase
MERILLDVHAHLIPTDGVPSGQLHGVAWDGKEGLLTLDGHTHSQKSLYRPHELLNWMTKNAVDRAWISLPPFGYRHQLNAAHTAEWTTYVNEGLLALANRYPVQFQPLFHLPVDHPALAADVAAHWIKQGRPRFAMAAGDGASVMLSDAAYEPLWTVLDAAKAFLFLHPSECGDPRLKPFHLHNSIGNPTETAVAAAHLVLSGVMDRHPNLRICLAHGGGTTAAVAGRIERGRVTGRPGVDKHASSLRDKFRRFCVDCIVHDAGAFRLACEVHGEDNVLFGSDWPFSMGMPEPHSQLAGIDPKLRHKIFAENPLRLGPLAAPEV